MTRKAPYKPTDVYLAYMRVGYQGFDNAIRQIARCKNAILRCITRKKHRGQAVAYFVYVSVTWLNS